ncbi:hypothetical protein SYNPS1DRAFT_27241 [Syncephalis pseudoplumigaleata]|uniref:RGS domain-containing protein n=1 Tax=Syncephalis pseudoplumigaleata TaxID=1712513 RepID=A0A4P9Z4U4_9FUNG|nr:hypothetical protein SYNPS1DRAFT_27241 [Syncephalis pseudoplumigaleata]|eukprot:RKP27092.1 hypothetical protein SYNPS1DRAFT_27241 [Syncephalis pseudoplumigaleata]
MNSVAIIAVVLLALYLVLQAVTLYLTWHYHYLPAIRHRSLALTYMLMASHTVLVINTLLALAFPDVYPCMLNPWMGGILLPSCMMMVVCRFYRLAALYRWNAHELEKCARPRPVSLYLKRISNSKSDGHSLLESHGSNSYDRPMPAMGTPSTDADHAHGTASSPAFPVASDASAHELHGKRASIVDRLLEAYTDRCAIMCTLAVAGILVVPALLVTFLRPYHDLRPFTECAITLVDMTPILASILLITSVGGGMIALRVMQARDAYGIRTELVTSIAVALAGVAATTAWVIYSHLDAPVKHSAQQRMYYYSVTGFINGTSFIVCNALIVNYPVMAASWRARKGAYARRDASSQTMNMRHLEDSRLSFVGSPPSYPRHFEQLLEDPLELASFRSHCVASFSIAACVFYERFSALQRHYKIASSGHGISLQLLPEFVDELEVLYRDFLIPEAPLSLANTLHPMTFALLQNAYRQRHICYDLLEDAAVQVKQHLFIWSYPAYANGQLCH